MSHVYKFVIFSLEIKNILILLFNLLAKAGKIVVMVKKKK